MSNHTPNFEAVLNHRGEISDQWVDTGGSNVVFRVGNTALKICLSLPHKHLENPALAHKLEGATHQEIERVNHEASIFCAIIWNLFFAFQGIP